MPRKKSKRSWWELFVLGLSFLGAAFKNTNAQDVTMSPMYPIGNNAGSIVYADSIFPSSNGQMTVGYTAVSSPNAYSYLQDYDPYTGEATSDATRVSEDITVDVEVNAADNQEIDTVFVTYDPETESQNIQAQKFDSNDQPIGPSAQITNDTDREMESLDFGKAANGDNILTFTSETRNQSATHTVETYVLDESFNTVKNVAVLDANLTQPSVMQMDVSHTKAMVAMAEETPGDSYERIHTLVYDVNTNLLAENYLFNESNVHIHGYRLTPLPSANNLNYAALVAGISDQNILPYQSQVYLQQVPYSQNGVLGMATPIILANSPLVELDNRNPTVALFDKNLMVSWEGYNYSNSEHHIYNQVATFAGEPIGPYFISSGNLTHAITPKNYVLSDNGVVQSFSSFEEDGVKSYFRTFQKTPSTTGTTGTTGIPATTGTTGKVVSPTTAASSTTAANVTPDSHTIAENVIEGIAGVTAVGLGVFGIFAMVQQCRKRAGLKTESMEKNIEMDTKPTPTTPLLP